MPVSRNSRSRSAAAASPRTASSAVRWRSSSPTAAAFRPDLTQPILRDRGIEVDVDGFNAELEKKRERSRGAAWTGSGEAATEAGVVRSAPSASAPPDFLGYATEQAEGQ